MTSFSKKSPSHGEATARQPTCGQARIWDMPPTRKVVERDDRKKLIKKTETFYF